MSILQDKGFKFDVLLLILTYVKAFLALLESQREAGKQKDMLKSYATVGK